ncbi:MAG: T9SS type A sorting domain-containing protein [Bacteroidetes bacterium]|nr:T9SS type A sorting domain-containing protein [Bacteroidota bacterium]
MKKQHLIALLFIFCIQKGWSQKEGNQWFFATYCGMDFNSGAPVNVPGGQTNTSEGSASVADGNGNLLFYTDGITIWNKNHLAMPNGFALGGGISSTQSAVILKLPGSANSYYVFTVNENFGTIGYSIVDMTLQGGNGDVTTKNAFIASNVAEKICAIRHANNIDWWIIVHNNTINEYSAYLLTSAGLTLTPVNSVGLNLTSNSFIGYLEANGAGTTMAAAFWNDVVEFQIYDFDDATGTITNPLTMPYHPYSSGAYGVEFSPSGQYLYTTLITPGEVRQYDLWAGNNAAILASEVLVGTCSNSFNGGMSLAPDGKIYIAQYNIKYLAVINNPDAPGLACNFVDLGYNLGAGTGSLGIPNFPSDIFTLKINASPLCFGDTTIFSIDDSTGYVAISWDFGDPGSGNNSAYTYLASHIFTSAGTYNVTVIVVYANSVSDTLNYPVTIELPPVINLGVDTALCNGQTLTLNAGSGYSSYMWQNSSTLSTYTATVGGTYFVEVASAAGCKGADSIDVTFSACAGPLAALSSSDTLWCDKTCIDFFDLSQNNPTSWTWYFQGASPSTSTDQNPTGICYNNYGSFDVTLVACNAAGCDSLFLDDFVTEFQLPLPPTISYSNDTLYASPAFSYQWFNTNNVTLVLSTSNYFVPVVDGNYFVLGFDSNGCATPSTTFGFYTGINNYTYNSNDVLLTPVDGGNYFSLQIISNQHLKNLSLIDVAGKQINLTSYNADGDRKFILDLNNVNKGVYFVKVEFDNYSSIRRLIKL